MILTRARILDEKRNRVLRSELFDDIIVEPGEIGVKGIYGARVVSRVYGSSELGNPEGGDGCETVTGSDGGKTRNELDSASRSRNIGGQRRSYSEVTTSKQYCVSCVEKSETTQLEKCTDGKNADARRRATEGNKQQAYCVVQIVTRVMKKLDYRLGQL
jgi:hypothetical protein